MAKMLSLSSIAAKKLSALELRRKYQILLIDDQKFILLESLRQSGFNITHIHDVSSIEDLKPYQVVVCDIVGVGKSFMSELGGGYVLLQAALRFPEKYLILYTGTLVDPKFEKPIHMSDAMFSKNIDPADWADKLDRALIAVNCPKETWLRLRRRMSNDNLDASEIANLEQAYIRSVLSKSDKPFADALRRVSVDNVTSYASLTASVATIIALIL